MRRNPPISVTSDSGLYGMVEDNTDNNVLINDLNTNKYKIGAWNINGFISKEHPENTGFKCNVINRLKFDAIFLSETFCRRDETISIPNYKVVQFNRQKISRRAVRGSGGCAIALSNQLLSNHVIIATYYGSWSYINIAASIALFIDT